VRTALSLSVAGLLIAGCSRNEKAEQPAAKAEALACDRACIVKTTDQYLAALVAHNPKAAPLSDEITFVENLKRLKPGEGLWKTTTSGPTDFKIYVPDVDQQEAGWLGMMQQDGKPVLVAVRLKLEGGRIIQAEHIVAAPGPGGLEHLTKLRPALITDVPEGQRKTHDELAKIGLSYYNALDDNDGSKTPFAADCQRRENGLTTAGEGAMGPPNRNPKDAPVAHDCAGQLDSGSFTYIDRIENRRLVAADPVTGLAMGFSHFRHPMTNLPYTVKHVDGSTTERNKKNMPYAPFDMPAAHIFKIGADGKVHEIEAVGVILPYNSSTGWE